VRLSCDPERLLPGAQSIIALGVAYAQKPPALVPDGRRGRVARYAWGRDYHDVIRPKLRTLADTIVAETGPATRCRWFVDTGPFVDRAAAERAGLGFIGKNTCVLTGQHGSLVFLSAILTTAHLEPDPVGARDCGSCRLCLDACPTGALTDAFRMGATSARTSVRGIGPGRPRRTKNLLRMLARARRWTFPGCSASTTARFAIY